MVKWEKHRLGDVIELIGGGTPKTSVPEYWNGGIPWLSVKDFNNDNRYVYETEKSITQLGLEHSSTKMLQKDDIIISARGTVGEMAMIPFPMAFNQSCYGVRGRNGLDQTFLYYLIKDLRTYLTEYQNKHQSSRVTIDNIRRILSSFFSWLEDEDYIVKSPVRRIHKVKTTKNVKDTFSDEDLEKMRDGCDELRDLAMIDLLSSTGMRVGEMVLLSRADINFSERECVVLGKGAKERIVYFDAKAKLHLQQYLDSRTDDNPALFVSLRAPYERIKIGGIEHRFREMGERLNIPKVHPHKFRRTLATIAIDKGMPIEQLQQLLGHQRIDTTLHYAMVKQSNVKAAHRKYIG